RVRPAYSLASRLPAIPPKLPATAHVLQSVLPVHAGTHRRGNPGRGESPRHASRAERPRCGPRRTSSPCDRAPMRPVRRLAPGRRLIAPGPQPGAQCKSDADGGLTPGVIDQALAVAREQLNVAAERHQQPRRGPGQLTRAFPRVQAGAGSQRKSVIVPSIERFQLTVTEVVRDVRIVGAVSDPMPDLAEQGEIAALDPQLRNQSIPAAGKRFGPAVRLMTEPGIHERPLKPARLSDT